MRGDSRQLAQSAEVCVDRQTLAEPHIECILKGLGEVIVRHGEIRICMGGLHDINERTKYSFSMQYTSPPRFRAGNPGLRTCR